MVYMQDVSLEIRRKLKYLSFMFDPQFSVSVFSWISAVFFFFLVVKNQRTKVLDLQKLLIYKYFSGTQLFDKRQHSCVLVANGFPVDGPFSLWWAWLTHSCLRQRTMA